MHQFNIQPPFWRNGAPAVQTRTGDNQIRLGINKTNRRGSRKMLKSHRYPIGAHQKMTGCQTRTLGRPANNHPIISPQHPNSQRLPHSNRYPRRTSRHHRNQRSQRARIPSQMMDMPGSSRVTMHPKSQPSRLSPNPRPNCVKNSNVVLATLSPVALIINHSNNRLSLPVAPGLPRWWRNTVASSPTARRPNLAHKKKKLRKKTTMTLPQMMTKSSKTPVLQAAVWSKVFSMHVWLKNATQTVRQSSNQLCNRKAPTCTTVRSKP